jgi:hypothetical protein
MPRQAIRTSEPDQTGARNSATLAVFALAALPTVLAIWTVPWFVTQDTPAHLYNAHIIASSLRPDSAFGNYYEVRWEPLPNWAGHLAFMGLLEFLSPRTADRVMMTVTFVGFAAAVAWLRWRVAGWRGMPVAAALAVLLALNMMWLLGFTSFLLGACLFTITLGVWWAGREKPGPGRAVAVAALLVVGYFCHLVTLGLTAVGLVVLAVATPGGDRPRRLFLTAVSLIPLVGLGVVYRGLMRAGGGFAPEWSNLKDPWSPESWSAQFGWVDPISLASKILLPFSDVRSRWCGLLAPVVWLSFALVFFAAATIFRRQNPGEPEDVAHERRGWAILGTLLLLGGVIGPDSFGGGHGSYLPQRLFLLGLVALVPFLELDSRHWLVRAGTWALAVALVVQSAIIWNYALDSDRLAGTLMKAKPFVGRGQRVGTLLIDIRGRYRSNPLLHVDNMLGVGTGNIIWSNYESGYYFFPVQVKNADLHPQAVQFEEVAILDDPEDASKRAELWEGLLAQHHRGMDVLVVWGSDPRLDALNARWFEPRVQINRLRVLRRKVATELAGEADGDDTRAATSPASAR